MANSKKQNKKKTISVNAVDTVADSDDTYDESMMSLKLT